MVGGHSIVYQVVPQNKFVFVLLDRLVVLFFVAGLMLNPPDVWMENIFRWKFLGDASMAARKELAPTKCTINLHLQHLEQQDFCNIRPEDTYRRKTKLSLKTTG